MTIDRSAERERPLAQAQPMTFAPTRDLARGRRFYEQQLGLVPLVVDAQGVHYAVGAGVLRLQVAGEFVPQRFTVAGFAVDQIDEAIDRLVGCGVAFERFPGMPLDDRGAMTFSDGARVAWFKDLDGNVLSLAQLPR